jgi:hypothetical protein
MTTEKRALVVFGIKAQLRKLAEECAECAAAALHVADRGTRETEEQFYEKLAKVEILLCQMRLHYGDVSVDRMRMKELARLEARLRVSSPDEGRAEPAPAPGPLAGREKRIRAVDAATKLGYANSAIYYLIKAGLISAEVQGRSQMVLFSEVEAYYRKKARKTRERRKA